MSPPQPIFTYRKVKVSVRIVPMLLAENRIPNTEYLLPAGHHVHMDHDNCMRLLLSGLRPERFRSWQESFLRQEDYFFIYREHEL